jgi:hypothetical protein
MNAFPQAGVIPAQRGGGDFMKIEIREVEDIKATSVHQTEGAGGA